MLWTPSNHGAIYVPAAGGGTWTQVYSTSSLTSQDSGYGGYTLVDVYSINEFSATGGTKMRFTLQPFTSGTSGEFTGMYVYDGSGTDTYDFGGTPTQVLVGGSGSFTLTAGGSTVVTDEINIGKAASGNLVVAWQMSAGDMARGTSANLAAGSSFWYKNAVEASTVDKTGYSDLSTFGHHTISKIELYI